MLNICSKPFLDFQFEFITSVLGLERNHRERAVKLVPPLCEEGCGLFMRALEAQYPGSTLKYAFIAHLFY